MSYVFTEKDCFIELCASDLMLIEGGGWPTALATLAIGVIGVVAGPPAVVAGGLAVGAWYAGSALIAVGSMYALTGK